MVFDPAIHRERRRSFAPIVFLLLLGSGAFVRGAALDSLIIGNQTGAGPFVISDFEVDSASLLVIRLGDTLDPGAEYRFLPQENALLLEEDLEPGQTVFVRFRKTRTYLPKFFSRRKIVSPPHRDSAANDSLLDVQETAPAPMDTSGAALQVGGVKSFGISASSGGGLSLQQSLQVQVEGKLSRQTKIRAVLSDQNLPLQPEGTTAILGELEQARIDVQGPVFSASLGGFPVLEQLDYIRYSKRIQGASGSATAGPWKLALAGANSRGTFHSLLFHGQEGRQGPYRLPGRDGQAPVTVMAGTESVWIDGQKLTRGESQDYTMDYSLGAITFSPRRMISAETVIMAQYEYLEQQYERFFVQGAGQYETPAFSARVTAVQEHDAKDRPLEFMLGDSEKAGLAQAGDNPERAGTSLLPLISESEARENGFYVRGDSGIYRYLPPDSIDRFGMQAIYAPQFYASAGGPYDTAQVIHGARIVRTYIWVGEMQGHFRPGGRLPMPIQRRIGDLSLRGAVNAFDFQGEGAVSQTDANTFSSLNDEDNQGIAFHLSAGYGRTRSAGLFVSTEFEHADSLFRGFGTQRDAYDYRKRWDLPLAATNVAGNSNADVTLGWKWKGARAQIEGGALRNGAAEAKRGAAELLMGFRETGRIQLRDEEVLRQSSGSGQRLHRDRAGLRLPQAWLGPFAAIEHEWHFTDSANGGRGYRDISAGFEPGRRSLFTPRFEAGWRMERSRGDNALFSGDDSLRTLRFSGLLDMEPWHGLDLQASAGQRRRTDMAAGRTSIYDVAEIRSHFLPRDRGVDAAAEYLLSATELQAFSNRYQYIGSGLGNFERDSLTGDFRPREGGGYELVGTVSDSGSVGRQIGLNTRMRLTPGQWFKTGGFLDDVVSITEFSLTTQRPQGVAGLANRYWPDPFLSEIDSALVKERNRRLSQEFVFQPAQLPWRGRFRVTPSRRDSYHYGKETEQAVSYLASVERWFGQRVNLGIEGKQDQSRRKRDAAFASLDYDLLTREIENTIGYSFQAPYTAGLTMGGGRSQDRVSDAVYDFYFLTPSMTRNFPERGRLRAEYTWNRTVGDGVLYYQMARGYAKGVTHRWTLSGDYKLGENLVLNVFYLGRLERDTPKPFHQANMDLRAFF